MTTPATGLHSPSEEEAKKAAACEVAEKLNEKIGKVKGKVVISSSENESKPTPSLLNKGEVEPPIKSAEDPISAVAPAADPIDRASSQETAPAGTPQPSADAAAASRAHQKQGSVHAHFLLGDVVHAGSRSRSGSGSRDRGLPYTPEISSVAWKKSLDEAIAKTKPNSPPPTVQLKAPSVLNAVNSSSESIPTHEPVAPSSAVVSPPLGAVSEPAITSAPSKPAAPSGVPSTANANVPNTAGDPRLPQDDGKIHILLAATGSTSTGKLRLIIHKLTEIYGRERACIQIILTKAAENFVSRGEIPSHIRIWRDKDEWENWQSRADPVVHIELRRWADILVIAPLSANTLGKIALGLCDNLLTCVVRAWNTQYPILIAPAMVSYAYNHPATRAHLQVIKDEMKWIEVLKPVEKVVGSYGDIGMGGMMDWNEIVNKTVLKLGGYPEDEDDDDDDNNDDNNEELDDNEDDDDDNDDDPETFADAITSDSGASPEAPKSTNTTSISAKPKSFEFETEDMDDTVALKKLSLAERDQLLEEGGKLRNANLTFS